MKIVNKRKLIPNEFDTNFNCLNKKIKKNLNNNDNDSDNSNSNNSDLLHVCLNVLIYFCNFIILCVL